MNDGSSSDAPRERKPKALIALVLTAAAGFLDARGARELGGALVAHMSGNTAHLATRLTQDDLGGALRYVTPLVGFLIGLTISIVVAEVASRRRVHRTLALVLGLELVMLLGGGLARALRHPLLGVFGWASAMGAQNATLRHVAGHQVRTTFVTGILVALTDEIVLGLLRREPRRAEPALLHAGIWTSFLFGALGGATASRSLLFPTFAIAFVACFDLMRPIGAEH